MSELERFAIQRDDGEWFAGWSEEGAATWQPELRCAEVYQVYAEAMEDLHRLQVAGHPVLLFGVS